MITFETGSTALPVIPGVTFLETSAANNPWFDGIASFISFGPGFGDQAWANLISGTTSGLGLDLATPVQAIGGYIAKIPNFIGESPSTVTLELLDGGGDSLGTSTITLNAALNSPVFFGFTADAPIAGFRALGDSLGFFAIDNLVYGSLRGQAVPEPSSIAMASVAALAGLYYSGRRRRDA